MNADTDTARRNSNAIRQYGKNIIMDFHRSFQQIPQLSKTDQGVPIPVRKDSKVGIIGAGVGGLYAAMLLQDQGIPFEILEASDRVGGRLFTHKFSEKQHDYYDVGAMRFPHTPLMGPVFRLFNRLGIKEGGKLIPYIFQSDNSTLFYNSILKRRSEISGQASDFENKEIPPDYAMYKWNDLVNNVVEPFANALAEDVNTGGSSGWALMMEYDKYSTKAYMTGNRFDTVSQTRPDVDLDRLKKMPYPLSVVDWCETLGVSTGWYDRALSETVIESLAFAWPEKNATKGIDWFCVDGGSSVISEEMVKYLKVKLGSELMLNSRVTNIGAVGNLVEVTLADGGKHQYDHVINTVTLPCLRTMDLTNAKLDFMQKSCLRELQYGPSTKIGIKFRTAWWEDENMMPFGSIQGGQSFTDNMSRTIVYPSYGIHRGTKSTVLIASYAWTADALALTALMGPDPDSKAALKQRILQDLVAVHGLAPKEGLKFLEGQYLDSFPYSWSNNLYSMGAFGFFGPGQFVRLFQHLTRPAAEGRLHFAGEAVSVRHAWVVGALEASERAVKEILVSSYNLPEHKMDDFEKKWGWLDDDDLKWGDDEIMQQIAISLAHAFPDPEDEGKK